MEPTTVIWLYKQLGNIIGARETVAFFVDSELPEILNAIGDSRFAAARISQEDLRISVNKEHERERIITELKGAYVAYYESARISTLGTFLADATSFATGSSGKRKISGFQSASAAAALLATAYALKLEHNLAKEWHSRAAEAFELMAKSAENSWYVVNHAPHYSRAVPDNLSEFLATGRSELERIREKL